MKLKMLDWHFCWDIFKFQIFVLKFNIQFCWFKYLKLHNYKIVFFLQLSRIAFCSNITDCIVQISRMAHVFNISDFCSNISNLIFGIHIFVQISLIAYLFKNLKSHICSNISNCIFVQISQIAYLLKYLRLHICSNISDCRTRWQEWWGRLVADAALRAVGGDFHHNCH